MPVVCSTCPDVPSVPCASSPSPNVKLPFMVVSRCKVVVPCTVIADAIKVLAVLVPLANNVCVVPPTVKVNDDAHVPICAPPISNVLAEKYPVLQRSVGDPRSYKTLALGNKCPPMVL